MSIRQDLTAMGTVALFGLFLVPLQSSGELITFQLSISGDQEVPGPGDEDGQASGTLSIDDTTNLISWSFTYSNIANPAAMHIHTGAAGEGGGVLVPLNVEMYGPSVSIHLTSFMDGRGRPGHNGPLDGNGRRSVYIEVRRNFLSPMMLAFDTPIPSSTVGRRSVSNVPAQGLILMNDPFVVEMSRSFAEKALAAGGTPEERVCRMYIQAFGRGPTPG